jgi:membrane protease subunit HflC
MDTRPDPSADAPADPQPTRRAIRRLARLVLVPAVAVWLASGIVFVDETEHVLVERFGRIVAVYDRPTERGLHLKWPWPIDTARRFDRRVQLFDPVGRELLTRDRKNITLDVWVCWRIAEPDESAGAAPQAGAGDGRPVVTFFRTLGSAAVAEARLDSRLRSILAARFGEVELSELLIMPDGEAAMEAAADTNGPLTAIAAEILRELRRQEREDGTLSERLGIEVVDFGIKRINFPEGNRRAVYERMKSERQKIAEQYRSAGRAEGQMIQSRADLEAAAVLAQAAADAQRIRGEAEAATLALLNSAHAQDPQFYAVLRTLESYRRILSPETTLVLSTSSHLFRLLTEGVPEQTGANGDEAMRR